MKTQQMKMWAISTPDSIQRSSSGRAIVWLAMAAVVLSNGARAEEPLSYNRDVRPILAEHCFACHGPDSASRKGELRLDQRQAAIDSGAVVPSNPQDSSLVERILSTDAELVMPPPDITGAEALAVAGETGVTVRDCPQAEMSITPQSPASLAKAS